MTGDDFQMIYQDTPGVLTPAYMLHVSAVPCVDCLRQRLLFSDGCCCQPRCVGVLDEDLTACGRASVCLSACLSIRAGCDCVTMIRRG